MAATCGLDFERRLTSPAFEVRRVVGEALRELGFQIAVDQITRIEAKRGGMLGYSLLMKKQMPLVAVFDLSPEPSGCALVVHLADNIKTVGRTFGVNRQFHELFDEVQARIDAGLAALEPASSANFAPGRFWSRSGDVGILEQSSVLTSRAVGTALGTASKVLDRQKDRTPGIWKGVDSVTFTSSAGEAVLSLGEAQALLGVAVMIASHPGSMPPNLVRDVESFAAAVELRLTSAAGGAATVDVTDAQKPVFEFLEQQAQVRAALPVRQLYICRSCRLEKIVNPDYKRIVARNEKLNDIFAGVTATVGKGGISPTFVLGQVFKLKKLDPEYVCSRCQGMEADERVVTFCPQCADLQRDVVLRLCAKCKFDFRTKASATPVWMVPGQAPAEAAAEVIAEARPAVDPDAVPPASFEAEVAAIPADPIGEGDPGSQGAPTPAEDPPQLAEARPADPELPAAPAPGAGAAPPVEWAHPALVPVGSPEIGPLGGKVCSSCRQEHANLWRVVVATPTGYRERFLCGATAACQAPSLVVATQV